MTSLDIPPSIFLSWPQPNYGNPVSRGPSLFVLTIFFAAVSTIAVALKVYTRLFIVRWSGWDDILIVGAWFITISTIVGICIGIEQYGWGRHTWDIPIEWFEPTLKITFVTTSLAALASLLTAGSLLVLYYRMTREAGIRWFRMLLHVVTFFTVVSQLLNFCLFIVIDIPVEGYWLLVVPPGTRVLNEAAIRFSMGIIKTIVNLTITTLPIPLVLRMTLSRHQKYGLIALFSLGYIITAAGALKVYYTWKQFYDNPLDDVGWFIYPNFVAAAVEQTIAITCACLPSLRPIWQPALSHGARFFRAHVKHGSGPSEDEEAQIRAAKRIFPSFRGHKKNPDEVSDLKSEELAEHNFNSREPPSKGLESLDIVEEREEKLDIAHGV